MLFMKNHQFCVHENMLRWVAAREKALHGIKDDTVFELVLSINDENAIKIHINILESEPLLKFTLKEGDIKNLFIVKVVNKSGNEIEKYIYIK